MASNLDYKQVANVSRRTWDAETYEKKAKERQKAAEDGGDSSNRRKQGPDDDTTLHNNNNNKLEEEFVPAPKDAIGPEGSDRAYLKPRTGHADIDSKVGTAEIISATAAATSKAHDDDDDDATTRNKNGGVTKTGVGWHCRVCDCFLKDSHTYLDHINGRKHQRALGYSMRVERSTKDQLQEKLQQLSKRKTANEDEQTETNFEEFVKEKDEEAKRRKEERDRKRKERKNRLKEQQAEQPEDEDEEELEAEIDPALASMMGFSGFGGGK
jgi:U4/U6.U5 tri-snRNP component SNU23